MQHKQEVGAIMEMVGHGRRLNMDFLPILAASQVDLKYAFTLLNVKVRLCRLHA